MNISCLQENLSAGLSIIRAAVGKDAGLPILSTLLLRAEGKLIYLHATNLEIAIQYNLRGKVEEEGCLAIPAKTFSEFINLLPKEKIELKTEDETNLLVTCKTYRTKIHCMIADDFPLLPPAGDGDTITCASKELKVALGAAAQAAAGQDTRPELHGVYINWKASEKKMYCVGTDAYRLSEKILSCGGPQKDISCIIPLRTVQELSRSIIRDEEGDVRIVFTENQIIFRTQDVECVSKVVQGQFPDYHSIIPSSFTTKAVIEREELIRAIKATSLFSRGDLNDVVCRFEPRDDKVGVLILSSSNTTIGENMVTLDVEMSGGENGMTLNYRYLLEGLTHINTDKIHISVVDTQSPCVITPVGGDGFRYLIMPIRE